MDQVIEWFLKAKYWFIWDLETISPYIDVLGEAVYSTIASRLPEGDKGTSLTTPEIGFFSIRNMSQEGKVDGYALYIAQVRLPPDKRHTLFAEFKARYQALVGAGPAGELLFGAALHETFPLSEAQKQTLAERQNQLVRSFNSLANRSLNRRRAISARLRYQVLIRNNSTCQVCGRRAPNVEVHVDHIIPLSWDTPWQPSNDPDDYQVLCTECNLGKGSLSWLTSHRDY
jgi:5-methylcytosine-specific restriction endonuclease McrA